MISPEAVWEVLAALVPSPRAEPVARNAALGRVLAAAELARVDVPASDVSAMDGYALDGDPATARRPVAATIAAGDPPGVRLPPGSAARIMTGAPLPVGADRVVPVENTDRGLDWVTIRGPVAAGAHVRRCGEVIRAGQPLLGSGTVLTPAALSWLASHGIAAPLVVPAPAVAIATTGDEVVAPETEPRPGQLRDSHTDFLRAALYQLGIEPHQLGIVPDQAAPTASAVRRGLEADVLVLCGGVSAGAYDLVEPALLEAGCEILVDAVAIQPGKPLVIARGPAGQVVFGLPGNPASVMVSFRLFARPFLRRSMGLEDGFWHGACPARLAGELPAAPSRDRIVPVRCQHRAEGLIATPLGVRGSHDLSAFAVADGLVRVRRGDTARDVGRVEVLPFG